MILGLAGCGKKPEAFRLSAPATLIPPGAKDGSVGQAVVPIRPIDPKAVCPPSAHGLSVQKNRVLVTVAAMNATSGPELFAWTVDLEKRGCIPANEAFQTAEKIIDALPLTLMKRSQLLQGRSDLRATNSLRVVAPVLKAGASGPLAEIQSVRQGTGANLDVDVKTSSDVIGYEIDWYDFAPETGQPGYRVMPRSVEVHIGDRVEHPVTPTIGRFQFGPAARWYELYMMTKVSSNDFDFVVFSAKTSEELAGSVASFQTDATRFLAGADPQSYTVLPHGSGINAYIRVKVHGAMVDLPKGSSVRQAIGPDAMAMLAHLKVQKLHDGKLYPVIWAAGTDQILSMGLEGGEEIDW